MVFELEEGCIPSGRAKISQGETIPSLRKDYVVVFKDYFACNLRLPVVRPKKIT